MNYRRIYDSIIERARHRVLNGYKENHHIIMKSLGGSDDKENRAKLTAREHFIAHLLYAKFQPCRQTIYAVHRLAFDGIHNSHRYEWLRKEVARLNGERNRGNHYASGHVCPQAVKDAVRRARKGKKDSEETKRKKSIASKGNKYALGGKGFTGKHTEETKKKISMAKKGRKLSEEHRKKLSMVLVGNKRTLGWVPTEECRKKQSIARKGNKNALGHKHTEATKKKMSEASKGNKHALGNKSMLGHVFTEESKKKMSMSHIGKKPSEETKAKMSLAAMGNTKSKLGAHARWHQGIDFKDCVICNQGV